MLGAGIGYGRFMSREPTPDTARAERNAVH
jgi:hypothetical protein